MSHLQPDRPTSSGQPSSNSISTSASDGFQRRSGQQWIRPSGPQRDVVHTFTWGPWGIRKSEAPHLSACSIPHGVFLLHFAEIITLLVVKTNRYYTDHLDRLDEGPSYQPDVTEVENLVLLAIKIQMEHSVGTNSQTTDQGLTITTYLLSERYETGQILSHPSLSTFRREQEGA